MDEEQKIYTIFQRVERIIEVKAKTRKEAHETVNAKEGKVVDANVRSQYICAVRSVDNAGTILPQDA